MDKLNNEYQSRDPQSDYHEKLYEFIKDKEPELAVKYTRLILEGTIAEL